MKANATATTKHLGGLIRTHAWAFITSSSPCLLPCGVVQRKAHSLATPCVLKLPVQSTQAAVIAGQPLYLGSSLTLLCKHSILHRWPALLRVALQRKFVGFSKYASSGLLVQVCHQFRLQPGLSRQVLVARDGGAGGKKFMPTSTGHAPPARGRLAGRLLSVSVSTYWKLGRYLIITRTGGRPWQFSSGLRCWGYRGLVHYLTYLPRQLPRQLGKVLSIAQFF